MGERMHDYTRRGWGHDYGFTPMDPKGLRLDMYGWGGGIAAGDYLLLQDGPDRSSRYQVENIRYAGDPQDMWFAIAVFAPRKAAPDA